MTASIRLDRTTSFSSANSLDSSSQSESSETTEKVNAVIQTKQPHVFLNIDDSESEQTQRKVSCLSLICAPDMIIRYSIISLVAGVGTIFVGGIISNCRDNDSDCFNKRFLPFIVATASFLALSIGCFGYGMSKSKGCQRREQRL